MKSSFFCPKRPNDLAEGQSFLQELKVSPHSGLYLLVFTKTKNLSSDLSYIRKDKYHPDITTPPLYVCHAQCNPPAPLDSIGGIARYIYHSVFGTFFSKMLFNLLVLIFLDYFLVVYDRKIHFQANFFLFFFDLASVWPFQCPHMKIEIFLYVYEEESKHALKSSQLIILH